MGAVAPAIFTALQVAGAVVRSTRVSYSSGSAPPTDALDWRQQMKRVGPGVSLDDLLDDLWNRGIPVVPLETLPAPSFQGLACITDGRPVILLGHRHDEPGHVGFIVAHEAGHVAAGDCAPDQPVIDADDSIADDSAMERNAELFATRLFVGADTVPNIDGANYRDLAEAAYDLEQAQGSDAGAIIFAWARRTKDFATATTAVKALYRGAGARTRLRQHFDRHVDLSAASETDRDLLGCVYGDPERSGTDS